MPAPVSDSTRGGGHLARDTGATAALLGRLAAAIAVTLLGVAWPAAAFAHTELVSASPADGASVDELPATIELTFSEALSTPAFVTVTDPAGAEVHVGDPTIEDQVVTQQTEGAGLAGEYEVEYRVVAGDGHAVSGSLSFTVTSAAARHAVSGLTPRAMSPARRTGSGTTIGRRSRLVAAASLQASRYWERG
jgi:methionine-rich copper-binding protein CopC